MQTLEEYLQDTKNEFTVEDGTKYRFQHNEVRIYGQSDCDGSNVGQGDDLLEAFVDYLERLGEYWPASVIRPFARADGFPTRASVRHFTEAEKTILDAVQKVEVLGASINLTSAVIELASARNRIANHIEHSAEIPEKKTPEERETGCEYKRCVHGEYRTRCPICR